VRATYTTTLYTNDRYFPPISPQQTLTLIITNETTVTMPKSKSTSKPSGRANPLAKKNKVKRPQVQVTYEDGQSRPNVLSVPRKAKDLKGKGKDVVEPESEVEEDEDEEEEDVKPIIVKEEDGDFQTAFEQSVSSTTSGTSSADFIIIAGSYEKNLYGIEGTFISPLHEDGTHDTGAEPELKLVPSFIFPAHLACIKSLSVSQGAKWLVTGSDDEYIKVWDLRRRKEIGMLNQHVGESRLSIIVPSLQVSFI
jgi:protein MAK11